MNCPRLIIIDSLTSCTAGIDTFRTDAFGPVLADLAQLSERRNVTTLCLAHFTKSVTNGAMLRVLGSVAVVALARAVYMLASIRMTPSALYSYQLRTRMPPLGRLLSSLLSRPRRGNFPRSAGVSRWRGWKRIPDCPGRC